MESLNSFDITYIEALSLRGKKELLLRLLTNRGRLQILFLDVVNINISNDTLDMDSDDVAVVDVCHEYRALEKKDLEHYLFKVDESSIKNLDYHIVKIHGNTVLSVVCRDIVVEKTKVQGGP